MCHVSLQIFGTYTTPSTVKKGYALPRSIMTNSDLTRIINSDEIQVREPGGGGIWVSPIGRRRGGIWVSPIVTYSWRSYTPPAPLPQTAVKPQKAGPPKHKPLKKNPLKNLGALLKLNPYAKAAIRREVVVSEKRAALRQVWRRC